MSNASLELGGDNWAAKDGNLLGYAVGDSSGKYVPREFTFTRGSNLAATRVAANGLIEKGRENLFRQSNQFDTTWGKNKLDLTSGQSGYDGSSDAWKITSNDTGSSYVRQIITSSGVQTASVYAAKGNVDYIYFRIAGSTNQGAFINLSNGTIDSYLNQGNIIDISINNVSGDWYRISITFNTTTSDIRFYASDSGGSNSETGSYIYIQDAQLEQGLVATDYIETGATTVQAGLLENEPRIDYTGDTGSLLLEPSRTNLIGQSEYISQSELSPYGTDVTHNATQSPSGKNSAALVYEESSNSQHYVLKGVTTSSSTTYTQSAFVKKKDSGIYASLRTNGVGGNSYIIFDFDTATIVDEGSDIISSGVVDYSNGWYRIHMTYTLATISFIAGITNSTTNPIPSYLGTGKGYYLWGAQVEQGSYPTSYIPNHSGGSVTRVNDSNKLLNQQATINATEGTLFLDTTLDYFEPNMFLGGIYGGGELYFTTFGSNQFRMVHYQGGTQASIVSNTFSAGRFKMLLTYKNNDWKFYINGVLQGVDTQGTFDGTSMSQFATSYTNPSIYSPNQKVHQFLYFDSVLSDAQCSALTVEGLKEEILTSYIAAVDTLEDGAEARLDTYLQNLEELIV